VEFAADGPATNTLFCVALRYLSQNVENECRPESLCRGLSMEWHWLVVLAWLEIGFLWHFNLAFCMG
jgi:hypothetical protein